jgi:hypothetical protein
MHSTPLRRIRRNHGLEHATLHVLTRRFPRRAFAGHSDLGGFWIAGDVATPDLQEAVNEALQRLRNGERSLAIHPNCGTNFVTAGTLAGLAGASVMLGARPGLRDKLERLPLAAVLATLALIASQPLGMFLQANLTTSGDPGDLRVLEIRPKKSGRLRTHRVVTQG